MNIKELENQREVIGEQINTLDYLPEWNTEQIALYERLTLEYDELSRRIARHS